MYKRQDVQSRMFKALGLTDEVANEKFGFLLDAFKYGVPPHAGLAYGLDRLVMLMAKRDSIRDVIAFPKVKDASCLLTNAPDVVDAKPVSYTHLDVYKRQLQVRRLRLFRIVKKGEYMDMLSRLFIWFQELSKTR